MISGTTLSLSICTAAILGLFSCNDQTKPTKKDVHKENIDSTSKLSFDSSMVSFEAYSGNPLFSGTGGHTWDQKIRERGFILYEDSIFKMWYTGYIGTEDHAKSLGYATSKDGITWNRYDKNPIFKEKWTEDINVVKNEGVYYMFAEGKNDVAHLLMSKDGLKWKEQGDLVIQKTNGDTISGPYGTPAAFVENGKWYLYYERNDEAIWLATSNDRLHWKNLDDQPVIQAGPDKYDIGAIAADQVIKHEGKYYLYYHASSDPGWATAAGASSPWSSNVAISADLIHWTKFPNNPLVLGDHSSPITVFDGKKNRLYTMHPQVCLYFGK